MQNVKTNKLAVAICLAAAVLLPGATAKAQDSQAEPESASGLYSKKIARAKHFMIVAANPYAAQAGKKILAEGGSAVDAAIAAQMVLNLVEPQSSGIGGGAFLLHWNEKKRNLRTYDGRETAPLNAREDRFIQGGKRMNFRQASFGGLPVGTPGLLRALELAHKNHGTLPWARLFQPAISLATNGFKVSPRLHSLLKAAGPNSFGPNARAYFFDPSERPWPIGHNLKNPALAKTLTLIAANGAAAFYQGKIANDIVAKVRAHSNGAPGLSIDDLRTYAAKERPPVCVPYRKFRVCGMGPPSSGALTVGQVLMLLDPFDLGQQPLNADALHLVAEAQKLSFADRKRYMADSDFVDIPSGLLDPAYLRERRKLIRKDAAMLKAEAGKPPHQKKSFFGSDETIENKGTSHISVVDKNANAVAMTTTIESGFGSNIMVDGFLLNNELTDFSFLPKDKNDVPIANRVEPRKRPRSSMAPTMVFDETGKLRMITGSPGGSRIIPYVVKTLIAHLDWGLNAQQAASLTNFGSRNGPFEVEPDALAPSTLNALKIRGQKIRNSRMTSGSHIIIRTEHGFEGGADPRREGVALGQ